MSGSAVSQSNPDFAQIEVLPPEHSGKILSARTVAAIRALSVVSPLLWVLGLGLALWGGMPRETGGGLSQTHVMSRPILFSFGAVMLGLSALVSMRDLKNRWLRHVARREIKSRFDSLLDPDAPDTRFVEVVPKSNWSAAGMRENAVDVGFLAIDYQKKNVLFEGDNERYRIPSAAIIKCEHDFYSRSTTIDKYGARCEVRFHFVVVTIRVSERSTVEVPFRIRISKGLFTEKSQRSRNLELLREINDLKAT